MNQKVGSLVAVYRPYTHGFSFCGKIIDRNDQEVLVETVDGVKRAFLFGDVFIVLVDNVGDLTPAQAIQQNLVPIIAALGELVADLQNEVQALRRKTST